jgi:hypothetical protein
MEAPTSLLSGTNLKMATTTFLAPPYHPLNSLCSTSVNNLLYSLLLHLSSPLFFHYHCPAHFVTVLFLLGHQPLSSFAALFNHHWLLLPFPNSCSNLHSSILYLIHSDWCATSFQIPPHQVSHRKFTPCQHCSVEVLRCVC